MNHWYDPAFPGPVLIIVRIVGYALPRTPGAP